MSIKQRLLRVGLGSILGMTIVILIASAWQNKVVESRAEEELIRISKTDLKHLATCMHDLIKCQDDTMREAVSHNCAVADSIINKMGGATFSGSKTWTITNQLTKKSATLTIPVMSIGGKALVGNTNPSVKTPVVDDVANLVGGVVTVFQRINKDGDMLCVATNIVDKNGNRAAGTCIPSVNPDGKPNPVVSAMLSGKPFSGMDYVVGNWCMSTYKPLKDMSGAVIGAVFVGLHQESVSSLRKAIMSAKIGKSGYVWVLGGKGETNGRYIVSKNGARDGEYLLDIKDSDGKLFIKEMIEKGHKQPGSLFEHRYMWKDKGATQPRAKLVEAIYYEPWGWLIGAGAYEDEFVEPLIAMRALKMKTMALLVIIGLVVMVVAGYGFIQFANTIACRLSLLNKVANGITQGDIDTASVLLDTVKDKAA